MATIFLLCCLKERFKIIYKSLCQIFHINLNSWNVLTEYIELVAIIY